MDLVNPSSLKAMEDDENLAHQPPRLGLTMSMQDIEMTKAVGDLDYDMMDHKHQDSSLHTRNMVLSQHQVSPSVHVRLSCCMLVLGV
jgi:hypothetical protein